MLLDTHAIIHRAYHALPPLTSPAGNPVNAVYCLSTMLMKLVKDLKPDHIVAAYDLPGPTHRHEVYKEYKGKRPKLDDDLRVQLDESRKVLEAFSIPVSFSSWLDQCCCRWRNSLLSRNTLASWANSLSCWSSLDNVILFYLFKILISVLYSSKFCQLNKHILMLNLVAVLR